MIIKKQLIAQSAFGLLAAVGLSMPASGAILDFQMNEAAGTELESLVDSGTSGSTFGNGPANVVTDGAGSLVYTLGNNAFVPTTPALNLTTGIYELELEFGASSIGSGTNAPEVGFALWSSGSSELFRISLDKVGGDLTLAMRIGTTVTVLEDFGGGVTSFASPLNVRAVVDLDTENLDIFWSGAATGSSLNNTASDLTLNGIRTSSNLQFFGATDSVSVDYVTLDVIPEPASMTLVGLGLVAIMRRGARRRV